MRSSAASDRAHRHELDRGQAAVELALCLPVVMLVLLGVVQVGVVVRDELLVQQAAREAARAASVSSAPSVAAGRAATRVLDAARLRGVGTATGTSGGMVRVTVRASSPTEVPFIGALLGDVTHVASAVMVLEPP